MYIFGYSIYLKKENEFYLKYINSANNPNKLKEPTYNHVNQSVKVDLQNSKGISSFLTMHKITIDHINAKDDKVTTGLNFI